MKFCIIAVMLFITSATIAQDKVGVQLYSFREQLKKDVPGTLEAVAKMGITQVEAGATYGLTDSAFKALLDKNQLTAISIGAEYKEIETNILGVMARAKLYGAKYVMCSWIPHKETAFTLEDANKALVVFNTAGRILKENGISLCYHAHGYEFVPYEKETLFDYMAVRMYPAYVNFEMDVFWIKHAGQDPVALLKKYRDRFPLMHLKDRKIGTTGNEFGRADVETNVVLGTGDVGIEAIYKIARKWGVKYLFIEDESSRSMQQVPQSMTYLKTFDKK